MQYKHLNLGSRYSIVSCIYFVPYILLCAILIHFPGRLTYLLIIFSQLPSNLFLRKLGVVHWLAFLVVSWGTVQLSMGFVPTWGYLCLTRALLGAFEVGKSSFHSRFFAEL